jgi:predicted O-methyltransferase YrrM
LSTLLDKIANKVIPHILPKSAVLSRQIRAERQELAATARQSSDPGNLMGSREAHVEQWLNTDLGTEWAQMQKTLDPIRFGTRSGAVNPGDQRALYSIVRALRPRSVLEVGTHVAASTGIMALALRQNGPLPTGAAARLVTVDLLDVNDPQVGAWKRIGCDLSPTQFMRSIKVEDLVTFVTSPATDYLRAGKEKFDLIFLDGDHSASGVYQEIPAACALLNPNGLIVLHDYFPGLQPLWSDGAVVPGVQLAVERLQAENYPVVVEPLGALPWPTKQGSNVSSLAVLCRKEVLAS